MLERRICGTPSQSLQRFVAFAREGADVPPWLCQARPAFISSRWFSTLPLARWRSPNDAIAATKALACGCARPLM